MFGLKSILKAELSFRQFLPFTSKSDYYPFTMPGIQTSLHLLRPIKHKVVYLQFLVISQKPSYQSLTKPNISLLLLNQNYPSYCFPFTRIINLFAYIHQLIIMLSSCQICANKLY